MADDTKPEETIAPAPADAPQEGQIDHKFFKRVQWGLTAATVFCGAAAFTASHFESKERTEATEIAAPVVTAKPVTPLVRAPG